MAKPNNGGRPSVCYVNPTLLLRRPISELAAQEAGKRKVAILTPRRYGAERDTSLHHSQELPGVELIIYPSFQLPFSKFEWPIPGLRYLVTCWKVLREYDVIHIWAHFYLANLLLILMSTFFQKKRVILTMDTLPGYSFSLGRMMDLAFKIYTWTFGRIVYGVPDAITLYGKALIPHCRKSGINLKKVHVIPTGIVKRRVARASARKDLLKEFRLKKEERVVLYAGLLNPRKCVTTVLDVAATMPTITFLIAGDGPSRKALEANTKERGQTNVKFLGWRKDLPRLLTGSDCLLFPSAAEGLPGIVMEAMQAGTPVVTTNIPCTTDLITDGKEGFLCPVGDVNCFSQNVNRVLKEKKLTKKVSDAAKKKIVTNYSWECILPAYERLYASKRDDAEGGD